MKSFTKQNRNFSLSNLFHSVFFTSKDRPLSQFFDSEMFTTRQIAKIFFPLLIDQFFIHLIAAISTSLVSSIGEAAMAAVSMVGTLGFIVSCFFFAVSMGGGIIIAQAKGSGSVEKLQKAIGQTLLLGSLLVGVVSVIVYFTAEPLVRTIYPKAEETLIEYAVLYLKLMMISQIPYSIFHAIFTAFRSVGDSRSSLVLTVMINVSHLLLSLLFINVMGLGVSGSGYSYIAARVFGAIFAIFWLYTHREQMHVQFKHFFDLDRAIVSTICKLGIPYGIEQIIFQGGMLLVQMYLSRWGATAADATMALAAHGVASSYFMLILSPGNTVSTLTSTICGQCFGAKKTELAQTYCRKFIKAGRFVVLAAILVLMPLSPLALQIYHPNPNAMHMIYWMLLCITLPMPFIWCNAYVTSTMLRSAGDAQYTSASSLISMAIGRLLFGYVFTIVLNLGPIGIWMGQVIEWGCMVFLMERRYRSGTWKEKLASMQSSR